MSIWDLDLHKLIKPQFSHLPLLLLLLLGKKVLILYVCMELKSITLIKNSLKINNIMTEGALHFSI